MLYTVSDSSKQRKCRTAQCSVGQHIMICMKHMLINPLSTCCDRIGDQKQTSAHQFLRNFYRLEIDMYTIYNDGCRHFGMAKHSSRKTRITMMKCGHCIPKVSSSFYSSIKPLHSLFKSSRTMSCTKQYRSL